MTITFTTTGSEHIYKINSNIVLRLYRNNHSVSILEFTDEMNNKIIIPPGIIVYTKDHQNKEKVVDASIGNIYTLSWGDDYQIEFNNKLLLNIKNNRMWVKPLLISGEGV